MKPFYTFTLDDEQREFVNAIMDQRKTIVFCNAVSGTGKTTLSMGCANILVQDNRTNYDGIVYVVSPYAEKRQGYVPGDQDVKSELYFDPAYEAMDELGMNPNVVVYRKSMNVEQQKKAYVKLMTHTYLRGKNTKNKVVIIDEAQNYTFPELKKTLTRCHDSCKAIVIGHTGQIDITEESGFAPYIEHFRDQDRAAIRGMTINHRGWLSNHADALEG